MDDVARIVLAVESEQLAQDVIDFLDRSGRAKVVDAVRDPAAVAEVVARERPDAVIGSPAMVAPGSLNGSAFLALDTEESVRVLRGAVDAGARGFYLWPSDRAALEAATIRTARPHGDRSRTRATVIVVYGPRGGVGTTFVSTHLAAACAALGRETMLIDADPQFGDVAWALGVPADVEIRTLSDLEPVTGEVSEEHVRNVLWTHPSGVRTLLAPATPIATGSQDYRGLVDVAAFMSDVVVVHVPRAIGPEVAEIFESASTVLVVLTLDVIAFRDAKRALESMAGESRVEVVVNRAARGLVAPSDVERVFGKPPIAVLPTDRRVRIAQDRGELLPSRSRMSRAFGRLAARLLEERP
jgi:Flp pilus assembly CpaE family ATPase